MTRQEIRASPHDTKKREIWIFPHNTKNCRTEDELRSWLLGGLRGKGGLYRLPKLVAAPVGSIVVFMYGGKFVGEAVVWKETKNLATADKSLRDGQDEELPAKITFSPSSIRLYAPPVLVKRVEQHRNKNIFPTGNHQKLAWEDYAFVLEQVVTKGGFVS